MNKKILLYFLFLIEGRKMNKKYVIFLNGEYNYSQKFIDKLVSENTVCFCADGGANFTFKYGKVPEMIIGDLDSI